MQTIGEKLKQVRKELGLTREGLSVLISDKTGEVFSRQSIRKWESGETVPRADNLISVADALGIPLTYFSKNAVADRLVKSDMLKIPVLSREWTACCGNGIPTLDITNSSDEFIPWPRDDFRALDDMRPPFAIYVEGDCLESIDIRDGDKVIINPAEEPPQGTVALTRRHGVLALRYVYRLKNGSVILKCDLGTSTLSPDDIEESDFAILGTLVGTFHPRPPALPL